MNNQIVLASTSPYRKELLERLGFEFETVAPCIDESTFQETSPDKLVELLAEKKARAVKDKYPDALIIGSDQVAVLDNKIIGKPGSHEAAVQQLSSASGREVIFYTGLCLYNSAEDKARIETETFTVRFRALKKSQIENYLRIEQPYNCAGSFKSEGLGVALFESMTGNDPATLIGLPMIRLIRMLEAEGVSII